MRVHIALLTAIALFTAIACVEASGDAADATDSGGCEGYAPGCYTCEYDAPVGTASCREGRWVCGLGDINVSCSDDDYSSCASYQGEVCCNEDGSTTYAVCPSPSTAYCPSGVSPSDTCEDRPCGVNEGYIPEDERCVMCDTHDDPNPEEWCDLGYAWRDAEGCTSSGTSWYHCTRCEELGPIAALPEGAVGASYEATLDLEKSSAESTLGAWSAEGLPADLSLTDGLVSGTPTEAGDFEVTLTFTLNEESRWCEAPLSETVTLTIAP